MLPKDKMIDSLDALITGATNLLHAFRRQFQPWTPDFVVWYKTAESTIEAIYGSRSNALADFKSIYYSPPPDQTFASDVDQKTTNLIWFDNGLRFALQTLVGFRDSLHRLLPEDQQHRPNPSVFISHCGPTRAHIDSAAILLKTVGLFPILAVDLPNLNMSINDKVRHYIGLSGAAIVLATINDEEPKAKGTCQNVIHEIGLLQEQPNIGGRIVYLKEPEVEFPSNIKEKGWIEFKRDRLQDSYILLLRELRAFGLIGR